MGGITGFLDHTNQISKTDLQNAIIAFESSESNKINYLFELKNKYLLGLGHSIDEVSINIKYYTSTCENYSISLIGSIYNDYILRETLIKYGITFNTLLDAEVILEAYKRWDKSAFQKLDGSFAFVLLDKKRNQILLVRDQIGAKPIYFFQKDNFIAFSTEIRALFSYPIIEKKINKKALANFFRYGYFKDEENIFEQIITLKKGTIKTIDLNSGLSYDSKLKSSKSKTAISTDQTSTEIIKQIDEIITDTLLKRNSADLSVGIILNGDYQSTIVANILQKKQANRIKTIALDFEGNSKKRLQQIERIAIDLKTNHQQYLLSDQKALAIVKQIPHVFDQPIANVQIIPLLFVAENTQNHIKTLLNMTSVNELFKGYKTYQKASKINHSAQTQFSSFLNKLIAVFCNQTKKTEAILQAPGLLNKFEEISAPFTIAEVESLTNQALNLKKYPNTENLSIKDLLTYHVNEILPNEILYQSDKCLNYYQIESKDALLKTEIINYMHDLDAKWFEINKEQQSLRAQLIKNNISIPVVKNYSNDFNVPLKKWLKTIFKPLVDEYITIEKLNHHQLLNMPMVMQIKKKFYSTRGNNTLTKQLWLILQFQLWYNKWM